LSPRGPVSIVLSQASRRVVVYRNGIEIGRARLVVLGNEPLTSRALVLVEGPSRVPDPYLPDPTRFHWIRVGVPGHMGEAGSDVDPHVLARIRIPGEFVSQLNAILEPGATVLVTDEPLSSGSSGTPVQVVDADPPHARQRS
jgi:hypothetical protein